MLHVATMLWKPNQHSHPFSVYDEAWVEKLYRGIKRNLTVPFRFVCFVDELRDFAETEIYQELMVTPDPDYGAQAQVYTLNKPTIFLQLDTIVVGNCDLFAEYCLTQKDIALSRDPYVPTRTVNGVALIPEGHRRVWDEWKGETDLTWMRRQRTRHIEDIWPNKKYILSYKAQVQKVGDGNPPPDARIIYLHGRPKCPDLLHFPWARKNWH